MRKRLFGAFDQGHPVFTDLKRKFDALGPHVEAGHIALLVLDATDEPAQLREVDVTVVHDGMWYKFIGDVRDGFVLAWRLHVLDASIFPLIVLPLAHL